MQDANGNIWSLNLQDATSHMVLAPDLSATNVTQSDAGNGWFEVNINFIYDSAWEGPGTASSVQDALHGFSLGFDLSATGWTLVSGNAADPVPPSNLIGITSVDSGAPSTQLLSLIHI